ncbi:Uma2 family endonuclease [Calothrix sp. 336/3]|uniref:Uma2 family endonuclease n=1 Tax=Calothrix sp. 336/3 TaxID=1337936 RepID=UPI0004E42C53|nr:Uma2 family endonuclease [Calothrix sp. 336/3]AKG23838.1 hypothetical protein IJ00_23320 [Calothrix sp. 336/3]
MVTNPQPNYTSPQEYLEGEKTSQIKHEYIDGEVYAMAGASDAHVTLTGNLYMLLRNHHRGSGSRVYMADMKVQVEEINRYFYPDVMGTCDTRDQGTDYFKSHPCLIIEVLSDSTEGFDRGKKFQDYSYLPSLQEYVLVSQDRMYVECFRKNEKGRWELFRFAAGETIEFDSINFRCDIAAIYEEVKIS